MRVDCLVIQSRTRTWQSLTEEAAEFATRVGPERLINISVSAGESGTSNGSIFVWYWDDGSITKSDD